MSAADALSGAPWLAATLARLRAARGKLPSALLVHDVGGAGRAVAEWLAALVLCERTPAPCGQCRACAALANRQHPDFHLLEPIEESRVIRIEQVRELIEQLSLTSHGGGASVALLDPADAMNGASANALLKTLEEPRAGVMLLLVAATPSALPATILSRCQRLSLPAPSREQSITWLERVVGPGPWAAAVEVLAGAPFAARDVDPVAIAALKTETDRSLGAAASGKLDVPGTAERWGRGEDVPLRLSCIAAWLAAQIEQGIARGAAARSARLLRVLDGVRALQRLRLTSINRALALEPLLWQLPWALAETGGAEKEQG